MISRTEPPSLPGLPRDGEAPVFAAPWEAHAFAMVLALHEGGLFTWSEWAAALSRQIKAAHATVDPDTGSTYYSHWLAALEEMLAARNVTTPEALADYRRAWDAAARRTPHGVPVELRAEDFPSQS
jgi:nitrile hydratase accessory protein